MGCRYLVILSRIWSAVLVHTNGRGLSFQLSIQAWIEAVSSGTDRWLPRLSHLAVSSANQRSTKFSQELEVGVKCSWKRGWASSQRWMAGVLWVEALSQITCTSSAAGTAASTRSRNRLNSMARWRGVIWVMTRPEARFRAAYRLVVPWRVASWLRRWGWQASAAGSGRCGPAPGSGSFHPRT